MAQTKALINALKQSLKSQGITYRQIAEHLEISEASVKRLFSTGNFSLVRLDKICEFARISLIELMKRMDTEIHSLVVLTEQQEQEVVADLALLLVAFLVVNGWEYDAILDRYKFSPTELIGYLAKLDRLKMIDLLPNNRFHLLISPEFNWRRDGPIQQFYKMNMENDFLNNRFTEDDESFLFLTGMLTNSSRSTIQKKMEELSTEFNELKRQDMKVKRDRLRVSSIMMAVRPWAPIVFRKFVRHNQGSQ